MAKLKTPRQLEKHLKGISNHRRIEILLLLDKHHNLTLDNIANNLGVDIKVCSEHSRRLKDAGLIDKNYKGRYVEHSLSPYGKVMVKFLKSFQKEK